MAFQIIWTNSLVKHYCSKVFRGVGHVWCCERLFASLSGSILSFVDSIGTVDTAGAAVCVLTTPLPAPDALSLYTLNFDRSPLYGSHFADGAGSNSARDRGGLGESRTRKFWHAAHWDD
jgi:hypothetical protein